MVPAFAVASSNSIERTLKDTTTLVAVDLNPKTVFCTSRGYGTQQIKVSVADLNWLAHFDHRVVGETLPCMTGGACTAELQPGVLIDPKEPVVLIPVRVVLTETLSIDEDRKTCSHRLNESVSSLIRGKPFTHWKTGDVEPLPYAKCEKLASVP